MVLFSVCRKFSVKNIRTLDVNISHKELVPDCGIVTLRPQVLERGLEVLVLRRRLGKRNRYELNSHAQNGSSPPHSSSLGLRALPARGRTGDTPQ